MTVETSFLYDPLGPRGRRRARTASLVAGGVLAALVVLALVRLGGRQQLEPTRWAILLDPAAGVPQALGGALVATLQAALIAMAIALVVGTLLAAGRMSQHRPLRIGTGVVVEGFRGVPLLLLMLFAALALPQLGIELSLLAILVASLVAYNASVICEIVRGGVLSIDRGQREAAAAMGLRPVATLRLVLLPQAVPKMLPVLVSQLVILLKDTSLGFIIGYVELLRTGRSLVEFYGNRYALQIYIAVAVIYIALNFAISALARALAARQQRGPRRPAAPAAEPELALS